MKILVLQDYLRSGGTERQTVLMARAFRSAGHTVHVVTFRPGGALADSLGEVPHHALQRFDLKLDWYAPGLHTVVEQFVPDVVLCMGRMANCWAGGISRYLKKKYPRIAVIATMRTGKALPWLFRRSLGWVRHVVANSDDARRMLVDRYRVPPGKITVIRNALVFAPSIETGPGRISDRNQSIRREFGVRPTTVVLLWVGMFRPEKNQRGAIQIVAQLPPEVDWQLWFVGEGSEKASCQALVKKLGMEHRVRFFGFRADPTPLYAAADVAVLTSRSESLSNFLIEAHAHGIPSVGYGVTGVVECGGRVVTAEDQAAFMEELLPLMRMPEFRRKEGDRMAAYAREHFSPAAQAGAYLELFQRLLENASG